MTRLSDPQLVILSTAAQREDGAILPLTIDLKGGAVQKVLASLERKELIARMGEPRGDELPPLCITRAGLEAIGVEPEDGPEAQDPSAGEAPFVEVTGAAQAGTEAQEPMSPDTEAGASETALQAGHAPYARARSRRA